MRDGNVMHKRKLIQKIKKITSLLCFIPVKVNDLLWKWFMNLVFIKEHSHSIVDGIQVNSFLLFLVSFLTIFPLWVG